MKLHQAPGGTAVRPHWRAHLRGSHALGQFAFRWRKLLETGVFATAEEIAAAENINASYVGRILRLTLLAPELVEVILDGRQPAEVTLAVLMRPFAVEWREQQMAFGFCPGTSRSD